MPRSPSVVFCAPQRLTARLPQLLSRRITSLFLQGLHSQLLPWVRQSRFVGAAADCADTPRPSSPPSLPLGNPQPLLFVLCAARPRPSRRGMHARAVSVCLTERAQNLARDQCTTQHFVLPQRSSHDVPVLNQDIVMQRCDLGVLAPACHRAVAPYLSAQLRAQPPTVCPPPTHTCVRISPVPLGSVTSYCTPRHRRACDPRARLASRRLSRREGCSDRTL